LFERFAYVNDNIIDYDWLRRNGNNISFNGFSRKSESVCCKRIRITDHSIRAQRGRHNILNFAFLSKFICDEVACNWIFQMVRHVAIRRAESRRSNERPVFLAELFHRLRLFAGLFVCLSWWVSRATANKEFPTFVQCHSYQSYLANDTSAIWDFRRRCTIMRFSRGTKSGKTSGTYRANKWGSIVSSTIKLSAATSQLQAITSR